jgi:hypothetical protein
VSNRPVRVVAVGAARVSYGTIAVRKVVGEILT